MQTNLSIFPLVSASYSIISFCIHQNHDTALCSKIFTALFFIYVYIMLEIVK